MRSRHAGKGPRERAPPPEPEVGFLHLTSCLLLSSSSSAFLSLRFASLFDRRGAHVRVARGSLFFFSLAPFRIPNSRLLFLLLVLFALSLLPPFYWMPLIIVAIVVTRIKRRCLTSQRKLRQLCPRELRMWSARLGARSRSSAQASGLFLPRFPFKASFGSC